MVKARASVFVGSSTEAKPIAQDFCTALYRYFLKTSAQHCIATLLTRDFALV